LTWKKISSKNILQ